MKACNTSRKQNVTDRAHRYRANEIAKAGELGPKVCHFCGDPKAPVMVGHLDGHEENTDPDNLTWTCRACNSLTANVLNLAGIGRLTHQYNPKRKGITFGQYTTAVQVLKGESSDMPVDEAVSIVRSTPAYRRSSFAKDVWRLRRERYGPSGRNPGRSGEFERCVEGVSARGGVDDPRAVCAASFDRAYGNLWRRANAGVRRNPVSAAAEKFERFTGRPATQEMVFDSVEHEHEVYQDVGELVELIIVPEGETKGVRLFGFDGAHLSASENWEVPQLFVIGGDQSIHLGNFGLKPPYHEREILGKVADVVYYQIKTHLGKDGGEADYTHRFAEETGKRKPLHFNILVMPTAGYDTVNQVISFWGGVYTIEDEGIRD